MAENYKHLYEQTKKMLTMYQDELIPGFRKEVEELKENLAEREKVVIQLRKQWQDAEMHICTMCGHFDHKTDGNIVYGNKTCGEICGYPFCKEKFTPWIPVTERLPEPETKVLVLAKRKMYSVATHSQTIQHIITTGMYEDGTKTTDDSYWWWETDGFEYVEDLDVYIIPEGWWEWKHYIGDEGHNYAIDDFVTHWMPLPEPPKEG